MTKTAIKSKKSDSTLVKSIKSSLREEDQDVASYLDFTKTDDEIITDMTKAKLLNFNTEETYD